MLTIIISSFLIIWLATYWGLAQFRSLAPRLGFVDVPNERSSHQISKPRAGGVVFICAWIAWLMFAKLSHLISSHTFWTITPSASLLATVGLLDDRFNLSAKIRFSAQLFAVLLFLWQLGPIVSWHLGVSHLNLGWFGLSLIALLMLWSINLFNFMDGTDGIASMQALFVLGYGAILLHVHHASELNLICLALCAAISAFLCWNWPPAKLFMGDVGSTTLGFIIIAVAVLAQQQRDMSLIPWIILYSAFLCDASFTLLKRLWRGEKWYQAHRSHAYQRLIQIGFSHRDVLYCYALFNCLSLTLASLATHYPHFEWIFLAIAFSSSMICYLWAQHPIEKTCELSI